MYDMGIHAFVRVCHKFDFKCLGNAERKFNFEFHTV